MGTKIDWLCKLKEYVFGFIRGAGGKGIADDCDKEGGVGIEVEPWLFGKGGGVNKLEGTDGGNGIREPGTGGMV